MKEKREQFAIFTNSPDGLVVEFEDRAVMVGGNCYRHQLWQMVAFGPDGSIATTYPPQDDEDDAAVDKAKRATKTLEKDVAAALSEGGIGQIFRCAKVLGVPTGYWV